MDVSFGSGSIIGLRLSVALAKKHVFCSEGKVAGMGCKTLACALAVMGLWPSALLLTFEAKYSAGLR